MGTTRPASVIFQQPRPASGKYDVHTQNKSSQTANFCRQLPSDSTSRWTPLPLTMQFPLLGLARDFHPLDNAHAERTKKAP